MKKNLMVAILFSLVVMLMLNGCAQPAQAPETTPAKEAEIYVVPDNPLDQGEYDPKIYWMDPNAPSVEIPDESVPLAAAYDISDGISEREAEAIAIARAGLVNNDSVNFLHSRYVDDSAEIAVPYYHVEFRSQNIPYKIWVDAANGEILLYEQG